MKKLIYAALVILAASGATALADYPVKDGNGALRTIKAFLLSGGQQLTQMLPSDTTGTPYSLTNPFYVAMGSTPTGAATAANQATANASLGTIATNTTGAATAANQTTANTSLAAVSTNTGMSATGIGAPADTAYAGSGSSSVIAALKGIYSLLSGSLTVSNRNSVSLTQATVSLSANTDVIIVTANANARYIEICNIGLVHANLAFDQAAVVNSGSPLAAANAAGDQGGCKTYEGNAIPTNAIHAISSGATSISVVKG